MENNNRKPGIIHWMIAITLIILFGMGCVWVCIETYDLLFNEPTKQEQLYQEKLDSLNKEFGK